MNPYLLVKRIEELDAAVRALQNQSRSFKGLIEQNNQIVSEESERLSSNITQNKELIEDRSQQFNSMDDKYRSCHATHKQNESSYASVEGEVRQNQDRATSILNKSKLNLSKAEDWLRTCQNDLASAKRKLANAISAHDQAVIDADHAYMVWKRGRPVTVYYTDREGRQYSQVEYQEDLRDRAAYMAAQMHADSCKARVAACRTEVRNAEDKVSRAKVSLKNAQVASQQAAQGYEISLQAVNLLPESKSSLQSASGSLNKCKLRLDESQEVLSDLRTLSADIELSYSEFVATFQILEGIEVTYSNIINSEASRYNVFYSTIEEKQEQLMLVFNVTGK